MEKLAKMIPTAEELEQEKFTQKEREKEARKAEKAANSGTLTPEQKGQRRQKGRKKKTKKKGRKRAQTVVLPPRLGNLTQEIDGLVEERLRGSQGWAL